MKSKAVAALVIGALIASMPVSHSADMVIKVSKTIELAADETVSISLEKFPVKAGIYLQQCQEPVPAIRPANCNAQTQLWISDMRRATFSPTATITMRLVSKFDSIDCTTVKCGIFTRFDHTAGTDTSEDQFIPITFASGSTVTTTAPEKTIKKQSMKKLPKKIRVGKSLALPIQTTQGVQLSYRSTSTKTCTVKANILRAIKAGKCTLQAFAPGSDRYENFTSIFTLSLKR